MAKVLTFSRTFPAYHPKKGQPTYFVEKFWNSVDSNLTFEQITELPCKEYGLLNDFIKLDLDITTKKHHTIRYGNRFKVGDKFSPRVWSGKPYNSKQIIIAPDIEIKKVWDIDIILVGINRLHVHVKDVINTDTENIALNDGLSIADFLDWFHKSPEFKKNKQFKGQIICWNENIEY